MTHWPGDIPTLMHEAGRKDHIHVIHTRNAPGAKCASCGDSVIDILHRNFDHVRSLIQAKKKFEDLGSDPKAPN